jgi:hypothetical protein
MTELTHVIPEPARSQLELEVYRAIAQRRTISQNAMRERIYDLINRAIEASNSDLRALVDRAATAVMENTKRERT